MTLHQQWNWQPQPPPQVHHFSNAEHHLVQNHQHEPQKQQHWSWPLHEVAPRQVPELHLSHHPQHQAAHQQQPILHPLMQHYSAQPLTQHAHVHIPCDSIPTLQSGAAAGQGQGMPQILPLPDPSSNHQWRAHTASHQPHPQERHCIEPSEQACGAQDVHAVSAAGPLLASHVVHMHGCPSIGSVRMHHSVGQGHMPVPLGHQALTSQPSSCVQQQAARAEKKVGIDWCFGGVKQA